MGETEKLTNEKNLVMAGIAIIFTVAFPISILTIIPILIFVFNITKIVQNYISNSAKSSSKDKEKPEDKDIKHEQEKSEQNALEREELKLQNLGKKLENYSKYLELVENEGLIQLNSAESSKLLILNSKDREKLREVIYVSSAFTSRKSEVLKSKKPSDIIDEIQGDTQLGLTTEDNKELRKIDNIENEADKRNKLTKFIDQKVEEISEIGKSLFEKAKDKIRKRIEQQKENIQKTESEIRKIKEQKVTEGQIECQYTPNTKSEDIRIE